MTLEEMKDYMDKFAEEVGFDAFESISGKPHNRPDLCAFLVLDRLCPGTLDMVCSASHDEIWLEVDPETVARNATLEDLRLLVACRVHYDSSCDFFHMFT